jgi:hypothetical protein
MAAEGLPGRLQRHAGLGGAPSADHRRQRLDTERPNRNVSHRPSLGFVASGFALLSFFGGKRGDPCLFAPIAPVNPNPVPRWWIYS